MGLKATYTQNTLVIHTILLMILVIQPCNNHEWSVQPWQYRRKLQNQNFLNYLGHLTALILLRVSASLRGKQNKTNFTVFPWVNLSVGDLGCQNTKHVQVDSYGKVVCCFYDQSWGIPTMSICRVIIAWHSSSRIFTGVWPNKKSIYCGSCSQDYALISPFIQTFCWGMIGKKNKIWYFWIF